MKTITRSIKHIFAIFTLLFFVCLLSMAQNVYAAEEVASGTCGDNATWVLDDEGTLTIEGSGAMDDYETASSSPWYANRDSIARVVIEEGITHIGDRSFYNCSNLTDVEIGNTVESVGAWAFYNNVSLEELTIPAGVVSLGNSSIRSCTNLSKITFDGNAPTIGTYVFTDCSASLVVHCYENTIGWDAAEWTSMNLSTEHLVDCVKEPTCTESGIKRGNCRACGAFVEEEIPALGHDFKGGYCSRCGDRQVLESGECGTSAMYVLYGDGVLDISGVGNMGDYEVWSSSNSAPWYAQKESIKRIDISQGMTSIGEYAFEGCINLTSITIPDSVTSIGYGAFFNCSSLTSITIPEGVTSIGGEAFRDCSSLANITIPEGMTSVEIHTFTGCSSLTSITIPDNVTNIGRFAFQGCSSLTNITIPDSVTSIGDAAFANCSNLTSITIPEGVTSIEGSAFSGCSSLTSITIPEAWTIIAGGMFSDCSSLTSITIPEGVTSIEGNAFSGCSSLTSITIPEGVTSIESSTFRNCSNLTSITIPDSVTSIGDFIAYSGAFEGCRSLTNIKIPDSVTSVGIYTFRNCSSLTSITIPDSVTSIGSDAFYDCSSLKYIFYGGTEEKWANLKNKPTKGIVHYSATDHTWDADYTIDKAATCTEEGSQSIHCAICNETLEATIIPPLGHQWNTTYTVDVPATESSAGSQSIHCSVCGAIKEGSSQVIPQLTPSTPTVTPTVPTEIVDLPTVKISKPSAGKKKITVKWKKVSKANLKKISGIQIQVATDPDFTNIVKTATAGKKKTSKALKGLQSKTKYYVRIRAYAADNHVSVWKTKSVKVK